MEKITNVHLCASDQDGSSQSVSLAVKNLVSEAGEVFHYRTFSDLIRGLRDCNWDDPVILLIGTDHELEQLAGFAEYLSYYQIVLVLHNDQASSLNKGHLLRPRILFSRPIAPETIAAVIGRMIRHDRHN